MRFPARHFAFPAREMRFPARHCAFPYGKCDSPYGISLSRTGNVTSCVEALKLLLVLSCHGLTTSLYFDSGDFPREIDRHVASDRKSTRLNSSHTVLSRMP